MTRYIVLNANGEVIPDNSRVSDFRGDSCVMVRGTRATELGRSGKVLLQRGDASTGYEVYSTVIDATVMEAPEEAPVPVPEAQSHVSGSFTIANTSEAAQMLRLLLMAANVHDIHLCPTPDGGVMLKANSSVWSPPLSTLSGDIDA